MSGIHPSAFKMNSPELLYVGHYRLKTNHNLESNLYVDCIVCVSCRKSDWRNDITTETRQVLEQWLWADYLLYDHFRAILDKKVQEYNQGKSLLTKLNQNLVKCETSK